MVHAGDVVFVPRGWWHAAINLEDTVAVTQNFVSNANLPYVLRFLRSGREDLVSGCPGEDRASLHCRFVEALRERAPEALEAAEAIEAAHAAKLQQQHKLSGLFAGENTKNTMTQFSLGGMEFSFGFKPPSV